MSFAHDIDRDPSTVNISPQVRNHGFGKEAAESGDYDRRNNRTQGRDHEVCGPHRASKPEFHRKPFGKKEVNEMGATSSYFISNTPLFPEKPNASTTRADSR